MNRYVIPAVALLAGGIGFTLGGLDAGKSHQRERGVAMSVATSSRSAEQIAAEITSLARTAAGKDRNSQLAALVEEAGSNARAVLENVPPTFHDGTSVLVRAPLLARWVRSGPTAALAFAEGLADENERDAAIRVVMRTWGELDPQAALGSAQHDPAYNEEVYEGWASVDVATAVAFESAQPVSPNDSPDCFAMNWWVAEDLDRATPWIHAHPNDVCATVGAATAVDDIVDDLDSGQAWALGLPPGDVRESTLYRVAIKFRDELPERALALAKSMKLGPLRTEIIGDCFTGFDEREEGSLKPLWVRDLNMTDAEQREVAKYQAEARAP